MRPLVARVTRWLVWLGLAGLLAPGLPAQTITRGVSDGMHWQLQQITSGLDIPWGMAFVADKLVLITERGGTARLVNVDSGRQQSVSGLPAVYAKGQGGLLDVIPEPGYQPGGWLYFTYSKPVAGGAATTLARARLSDRRLHGWQDLLITQSASTAGRHFGSRIAFDDKQHVFFSIGDRAHRPNGQDLSTHAGAILRLNLDGSVPTDNPFVANKDALPEIWSYGHRNPQGLLFDPDTRRLWAIEHGPRGGDELNLIEPGENYGWAEVSLGKEYWGPMYVGKARQLPGMVNPRKSYTPSISPSSLLLYSGDKLGQWQGNLFAGALSGQHLNRIILDPQGQPMGEERLLSELGQRIRSLAQSPDGDLLIATDSGYLYRLTTQGRSQ